MAATYAIDRIGDFLPVRHFRHPVVYPDHEDHMGNRLGRSRAHQAANIVVIAVAVLSLNACKGESAVAPTPGISLSLSGANQQDTYTMQDHLGNDLIISRKIEAVVENVGPDEMRLKVTTEASGGNGT